MSKTCRIINYVPNFNENDLFVVGWGLYYKFLVAVACTCNLACGFSFMTITHIVALSTCDEYSIPEINVLRINTCYLIGKKLYYDRNKIS